MYFRNERTELTKCFSCLLMSHIYLIFNASLENIYIAIRAKEGVVFVK